MSTERISVNFTARINLTLSIPADMTVDALLTTLNADRALFAISDPGIPTAWPGIRLSTIDIISADEAIGGIDASDLEAYDHTDTDLMICRACRHFFLNDTTGDLCPACIALAADDDPICVCGVHRSEHSGMGCEQWERGN